MFAVGLFSATRPWSYPHRIFQRAISTQQQQTPLGIYVHFPYCKKRCPYCAFNVYVPSRNSSDRSLPLQRISECWKLQLRTDVKCHPQLANKVVKSIYFGGGTPSLADPHQIGSFISHTRGLLDVSPKCEISVEVNPSSMGTSQLEKLEILKSYGVNRLSIGVQSIDEGNLSFLGRDHSVTDALDTITIASKLFDRVSVDLMYGLPTQTLESWERELRQLIQQLPPSANHLSLYNLNIEAGTNFYWRQKEGSLVMPDDDKAADFYEITCNVASQLGFRQYEVSSFNRHNDFSIHNLNTWRGHDYLGIGPGAHGRITVEPQSQRLALRQRPVPESWMQGVESGGQSVAESTLLDGEALARELILVGLRPTEGILKSRFIQQTGSQISKFLDEDVYAAALQASYLIDDEIRLQPTVPEGILRLDALLSRLIRPRL